MHRSKLAGFIIDCDIEDLDAAAEFWGQALGAPPREAADLSKSPYIALDMRPDEPYAEVQKVAHPSRVHLDIESDDIEKEVTRLERLGASRVADIREFVVMEAPTGQRFCVVRVQSRDFAEQARVWEDQ